MQRCSHGLLWMDTNQLGSGHGCAAEHTKREALPQLSSTHCTKRREKKKMRRDFILRLWSAAGKSVSLSLKILKSRTRRIHLCAASLTSIQRRLMMMVQTSKKPRYISMRRSGPHKQQQHLDSLTDWRTMRWCLHLTQPEPSPPNQLVSAHLNHYWHWS